MRTVSMRIQVLVPVFFFCAVLVALPLFGQNGDPPGRVARLSYMEGSVSFEPSGENNWSQASLNYPLTTGDRVWTDKGARAELETGNIAIRICNSAREPAQAGSAEQTGLTFRAATIGLAQATVFSTSAMLALSASPSDRIRPASWA